MIVRKALVCFAALLFLPFAAYARKYPSEGREFDRRVNGELRASFEPRVGELIANANEKAETIATRKASQNTIEGLAL